MDESAVGTQFDFGETNNVATGFRTINLEHPIIYAHNNKLVQIAEDGDFRKLRDAGKPGKPEIVAKPFQVAENRLVKRPDALAFRTRCSQQGFVILVNQKDNGTVLFVCGFYNSGKTRGKAPSRHILTVVLTFFFANQDIKRFLHISVRIADTCKIEIENRILFPLFLQFLDGKSFEQFIFPLEISLKRRGQQTLAEAARTRQKVLFAFRYKLVD